MANKSQYYKHSGFNKIARKILPSDVLVISTPTTKTPSGFETSNILAKDLIPSTQKIISEHSDSPLLTVYSGTGLTGTGSPSDPIQIDFSFLTGRWVPGIYSNVSQVGTPGSKLPINVAAGTTNTFTTTAAIPYHIAGISGTIPANTVFSGGTVRPIYFYLEMIAGKLTATFSESVLAETNTRVYIGKRTTTTAETAPFDSVSRIGNYRISEGTRGGSTAASQGTPSVATNTLWGVASTATAKAGISLSLSSQTNVDPKPLNRKVSFSGSDISLWITNLSQLIAAGESIYISSIYNASVTTDIVVTINGFQIVRRIGPTAVPIDITDYLVEGTNKISNPSNSTVVVSGQFI